ncbi:MAG: DUF2326 domain-containing protein [Sulfurimonas sp.]|jgi:uncharacterized protein YydD (DUF2326 family)
MFLKQLLIGNNDFIIRDITFHKGINLILDNTKSEDKKESGNNVGKSTVIKLIDFCFGSKAENIYVDSEFKKPNIQVENFLKENNIIITLKLVEDLENETSYEVVIKRNFLKNSEKIQEVNGETIRDDKKFQQKLKELIFKSSEDKPTFKQIISKNIRDDKNRVEHTLKVLNPYTSQDEYESLYLYWLGIDLDSSERKQKLLAAKKIEENLQKRLKKESNISQIEQALIIVSKSINSFEVKKETLSINPNYNEELENLNQVKSKLNKLSANLGRLELRRELILESKEELEKDFAEIDVQKIKNLYDNAKKLIPSIQKSFEETLTFHNEMVKEKIRYITEELPNLESQILIIKNEIDKDLQKELNLTAKLQKSKFNEELQEIITNLTKLYEQKGNLEEKKRLWESSLSNLKEIIEELERIDKGIQNLDELIQKRITKFNEFFSDLSYRLYGEHFILSSQQNEKGFELVIDSISGKLGTGKKKGQIFAFDLAYMQFADELDIKCLHFVLLDQIENVHDNQLSNLLLEIINNINGQYILPVLTDKLPEEINAKQYEVLSLSQNNKLFKIK